MNKYHVILSDDLGEEFSVEIQSDNKYLAWDIIAAEYPESKIQYVQELKPYNREY